MSHLYHIEDNGPCTPAYKYGHSPVTPVKSITHCQMLLNKLVTGVVKTERNIDTEKNQSMETLYVLI